MLGDTGAAAESEQDAKPEHVQEGGRDTLSREISGLHRPWPQRFWVCWWKGYDCFSSQRKGYKEEQKSQLS